MSESTTSAQCTAQEWQAAAKSGLMTREQGTNHFDEAVHKFAEMVREKECAKIIRLEGEAKVLRELLLESTSVISEIDAESSTEADMLDDLQSKIVKAVTGTAA